MDGDMMDRTGYVLVFEDTFDGDVLDDTRWFPYYLPQWSSRAASAARYRMGDGFLRLVIEADQRPWCPEWDGDVIVSSIQTGVFAGPVGSAVGQQRFKPGLVVREEQPPRRLYTPRYGLFELRARAIDDPDCMVALWLIGYDKAIRDDFEAVPVPVDVREFHVYAAEWTPDRVAFFVDGRLVRTVDQSPDYPLQVMLSVYRFPGGGDPGRYPKEFTVDYLRGYEKG